MGLSHSPKLVMSGLIAALDFANIRSYPGTGITVFDLSGQGAAHHKARLAVVN